MKSNSLPGRLAAVLSIAILAIMAWSPNMQAQSRNKTKTKIITMGDGGSYLGVEMEDVTDSNVATYKLPSERGIIVRSVEKGSPAETAGLHENDVLLEYAGMPVFSTTQFSRMVHETPVGRKVDLVVSRDGKKLNLSAKIGERQGESGESGHIFRTLPDKRDWQGFGFEGPDGQTFNFRIPGGPGNTFVMPRGGSGFWYSTRPRLGVEIQALTPQRADFLGVAGKKGVLVASVTENSPASGRLKAGDVILSVDGKSIESPEDLTSSLAQKESGAKVDLKIIRDKREQTISVELSKDEPPAKKKGYSM